MIELLKERHELFVGRTAAPEAARLGGTDDQGSFVRGESLGGSGGCALDVSAGCGGSNIKSESEMARRMAQAIVTGEPYTERKSTFQVELAPARRYQDLHKCILAL
jgi:hypothetical protein